MFVSILRTRILPRLLISLTASVVPLVAYAAAPTVSSFTPADNATSVSVLTSALSIQFDQVVQGGAGTISLRRSSDNSLIESITVPDAQVTGSGTSNISIALTSAINEYNAGFYVQITSGTFRNGAGEIYAGIADTTTWNFTTASLAAPAVSALTPSDDATDVAVGTQSLTIEFDKVVQGGAGNITVRKVSDSSTFEAIAANSGQVTGSGSSTITVSLSSSLGEYSQDYYVLIDANAFHNIAGVFYAGIADSTTWNFITESVSGGGSGRNYRNRLKALRTVSGGSSSDLGLVEIYSEEQVRQTITDDTTQMEDDMNDLEVDEDTQDVLEPEDEDTEDATEEQKMKEPKEPSMSIVKVEYKFKRRVCKRVASNFKADVIMMGRVNKRLNARFRFMCSEAGLPR